VTRFEFWAVVAIVVFVLAVVAKRIGVW